MMNFITELCESNLIRHKKSLNRFQVQDIADLIYAYYLGLHIMRMQNSTCSWSSYYAQQTLEWNDFDQFRFSANDLYVLNHVLFGEDNQDAFSNLKNSDKKLSKKLHFDLYLTKKWLGCIAHKNKPLEWDDNFLLKQETLLQINDSELKEIRRVATNWNSANVSKKSHSIKQLIRYLLTFSPNAEILEPLKDMLPQLQNIDEQASCGSVGAGAISAVAQPLDSKIQRRATSKSRKIDK